MPTIQKVFLERIVSKLRAGDVRHSPVKQGNGVIPDKGRSMCKGQGVPGLLKGIKDYSVVCVE